MAMLQAPENEHGSAAPSTPVASPSDLLDESPNQHETFQSGWCPIVNGVAVPIVDKAWGDVSNNKDELPTDVYFVVGNWAWRVANRLMTRRVLWVVTNHDGFVLSVGSSV